MKFGKCIDRTAAEVPIRFQGKDNIKATNHGACDYTTSHGTGTYDIEMAPGMFQTKQAYWRPGFFNWQTINMYDDCILSRTCVISVWRNDIKYQCMISVSKDKTSQHVKG